MAEALAKKAEIYDKLRKLAGRAFWWLARGWGTMTRSRPDGRNPCRLSVKWGDGGEGMSQVGLDSLPLFEAPEAPRPFPPDGTPAPPPSPAESGRLHDDDGQYEVDFQRKEGAPSGRPRDDDSDNDDGRGRGNGRGYREDAVDTTGLAVGGTGVWEEQQRKEGCKWANSGTATAVPPLPGILCLPVCTSALLIHMASSDLWGRWHADCGHGPRAGEEAVGVPAGPRAGSG